MMQVIGLVIGVAFGSSGVGLCALATREHVIRVAVQAINVGPASEVLALALREVDSRQTGHFRK